MSAQILIGGDWCEARSGARMDVVNPATEEPIAQVPACDVTDVDLAVRAASEALPGWLETTPAERSEILLELAAVIDANADELAEIESRNVGKPLADAREEIPGCAADLRFFAAAARLLEGKSAG